ncbi:MAG TPA: hypothetical protein PKX93_09120, partial [bacterium]|nr:hypothetical protein [bacterium]
MQKDSGGRRWRPRQLFFLLFLLVSATAICLISAWHSAELVLASLKKGETGRLKLSSSRPVSSPAEGWKVWLSQKETVDIAFRENHYFLATARGGIIVYDQNLKPVQQITSLEGLLENAVTALTVSGDTLWIALKHYGLVALCEGKILSYTSPAETEYPVSCLTDSPEGLLVGTMGDGVLKLSGSSFVRVAGLSGLRVRCLAYDQHRILVGTDDRGVIQLQGRVPVTISVREGLSSLTVFDVLACGDYFLVATAEGVFRVSHDRQARCVLEGFSTALGQISGTVWAGTLMAGLRPVGVSSFPEQLTGQRINRIKTVGGRTFVLTDDGAYVWLDRHWERLPDLSSIPSGFITSVAEGSRGLYAGTFEEGLLLLEDGRLRKQVTNEELREVNCLFLDEDSDQLLVGTGSGLIFLNLDGKWQGQLTEEILGGSVSGLCRYGRYIACALSGGGVCLLEGKELFNLSRFQGLVNNHAYSCCVFDSLLYIGTLGGVSVLSGKK